MVLYSLKAYFLNIDTVYKKKLPLAVLLNKKSYLTFSFVKEFGAFQFLLYICKWMWICFTCSLPFSLECRRLLVCSVYLFNCFSPGKWWLLVRRIMQKWLWKWVCSVSPPSLITEEAPSGVKRRFCRSFVNKYSTWVWICLNTFSTNIPGNLRLYFVGIGGDIVDETYYSNNRTIQ